MPSSTRTEPENTAVRARRLWLILGPGLLTLLLVGVLAARFEHRGEPSPVSAVAAYLDALQSASLDKLSGVSDLDSEAEPAIKDLLAQTEGKSLKITGIRFGETESNHFVVAYLTGTLDGRPYDDRLLVHWHNGTFLGLRDGWFVELGPAKDRGDPNEKRSDG